MKRIFSLLMVLALCMGICLIPAQADTKVAYKTRNDFDWGMNHHEGQYRSYQWEYMEEQIHLSAKAGCTMIRIGGDISGDLTYQDQLVGLCNKYGMKVIMVFKPTQTMGLEYITLACKTLAERYNGKNGRGFVDYIQVWNETDAILIKAKFGTGGPLGKVFDDYYTIPVDGAADLPEYTEYFRAAAKGIHEADSNTKFMINFCGQHWACLIWYLQEGVDIDVIGWDTYGQSTNHQEATEMFKRDCDELYDEIISKYNIPVIICESNTSRDLIFDIEETKKIENYETLFNMMKIAYGYDWIKGFTIYELFDEPYLEDGEKSWGMVECDSNGIIGEEKPVYWELQRLLGGNENLKMLDRSVVDLKPYEKLKVDTTDDSHIGNDDAEDTGNKPNNDIKPESNFQTDNKVESKPDSQTESGSQNGTQDGSNIVYDTIVEDNVITKVTEKQEVITVEPDNVFKQLTSTQTIYQMPWLIFILSSVGLLLVAGGVIVTFIIIDKKKVKKISRNKLNM